MEEILKLEKEKITLFSVLPEQALLNEFEAGFISSPNDKNMLKELWRNANDAYQKKGLPSRSFIAIDDINEITGIAKERRDEILERARKYAPYDTHQISIKSVRTEKLVTPQIRVDKARAKGRCSGYNLSDSNDLIKLQFDSPGGSTSINRQIIGIGPNGGSILFTSYDEDIRAIHPPVFKSIPANENDAISPIFESLCIPVGGGVPFASAVRLLLGPGTFRIVLWNGIHRCLEMARAGIKQIPLLLFDLPPFEVPEQIADIPNNMLSNPSINVPLITDFLDSQIAIPLRYHPVLKTIRINWGFEQYVTVLR